MPKPNNPRVYLGIDPGTHRVGYGAIRAENGKFSLIEQGIIEKKEKGYAAGQLSFIYREILSLIKKLRPDEVAVEKLFFSKNQTTAMAVAEARGVILLAAAENSLPIREFTPNTVKQSVSGYGSADKKAVLKMITLILGLKDFRPIDDASDALAIAITAALITDR
ncbi:MAG: crossover junction endodeoxyribonuclease RuvC [Parcubacteria group bacterium]